MLQRLEMAYLGCTTSSQHLLLKAIYQIVSLHASLSVLQGSATTDTAGQQLPKCAHENISLIKVVAGST